MRQPRARPPPHLPPAGPPRARHDALPSARGAPSLPRIPPPLTITAVLPAPPPALVAPMHYLQAGRRPSFPLLALFRACHAARSLPELRPAATPRHRPLAVATARCASS
jgi:hypothetical protein